MGKSKRFAEGGDIPPNTYPFANSNPTAPTNAPPVTVGTKPEPLTDMTSPTDSVQTFKKGGSVSSASKRADGIAQRGKTKA